MTLDVILLPLGIWLLFYSWQTFIQFTELPEVKWYFHLLWVLLIVLGVMDIYIGIQALHLFN